MLDDAYWAQWSEQAHARFARIIDTQYGPPSWYGFEPSDDLPRWLADLTAGHLVPSDAPTLAIGRVWTSEIDWATAIAEHPGDVRPAGPGGPAGPSWDDLTAAHALLRRDGHRPFLDLELEVLPDASLGLVWNSLGLDSARLPRDSTWIRVCRLLAPADLMLPHTPITSDPSGRHRRAGVEMNLLWWWGTAEPGDGIIVNPRPQKYDSCIGSTDCP